MKKFILASIFAFFLCSTAFGQNIYEERFEAELLQEDFRKLTEVLEHGQPALYRYQSPKEWNDLKTEIERGIFREMNEFEFLQHIRPLTASIRDGNTVLMPSEYADGYLRTAARLFPFDVRFIDGKTYVYRNFSSDSALVKGSEILTINGEKTGDLLQKFIKKTSGDGFGTSSALWRLEQDGFMFELAFALPEELRTYSITYKLPGKKEILSADLRGVSYRLKAEKTAEEDSVFIDPKEPYQLIFNAENESAYMQIGMFGDYFKPKTGFIKFCRNAFKELESRQVKSLVLDLRDNGGGEELFAAHLASYFLDSAFQFYDYQYISRESFNFTADAENRDYARYLASLRKTKTAEDTFKLTTAGLEKFLPVERTGYKGRLYILLNGGTFSVASDFAALIKAKRENTYFVGEESGGNAAGSCTHPMPYLELPNTNLLLSLPLVRNVLSVNPTWEKKGRGVIPDLPKKTGPDDLISGKDAVLEFVNERLDKEKKMRDRLKN